MLRGRGRRWQYGPIDVVPRESVLATWDPLDLAAGGADLQIAVTAWDLAIVDDARKAERSDSDYTVGITVGLTLDDRLVVRRLYRARGLSPRDIRTRILDEAEALAVPIVVVENNAAQRAFESDLRAPLAKRGARLVGHTTTAAKHSVYTGVPSLSVLFEAGLLDLDNGTPAEADRVAVLVDELHGLGLEAHDDTVMALWMAVSTIRAWVLVRDAERRRLLGPRPEHLGGGWLAETWEAREAA